jgi:alpha-galactosidase
MQETVFRHAHGGATVFRRDDGAVWLAQLHGLTCGFHGRNEGRPRTCGLLVVDTPAGRFEDRGLTVVGFEARERCVRLAWQTPDGRLRIESDWALDQDTDVWSRQDTLINPGAQPVVVRRCLARFPFHPATYEIYSQGAHWCNENQGLWRSLRHGTLVLGCEGGRTCQGATPYMGLRRTDGGAVAFHVLPVGNWTMRASGHTAGGAYPSCAVVEIGLADEPLQLELPPGATVTLPQILIQAIPGDQPHLAAPAIHDYLLRHHFASARPAPVVYNTWFDAFEKLDVPRLRAQLAAAKQLGCEVLTVDAGWYGAGTGNWFAQVGDWREKPDGAFHGRMSAFVAEVRAAGLGFGLWIEPERIAPTTPVFQSHPDWFLPGGVGHYYPRLDEPAVYEYVRGELVRVVETYALDWLKIDFNFELGLDPSGTQFLGYYQAWYRLLDELRATHPALFLEGCASGGMRTDINTIRRFDVHFLSDTVDPRDILRIYQGALLRLPPGVLASWVALRAVGWPGTHQVLTPTAGDWTAPAVLDIDFAARACMPMALGVSGDVASLPPEVAARLGAHVAFFKRWRGFIRGAHAHLLTPPADRTDRAGWAAIQLQRRGDPACLLFVYCLDDPTDVRRFQLRGLAADQEYRLTSADGNDAGVFTGARLMGEGLAIRLGTANSAEVFVLSRGG